MVNYLLLRNGKISGPFTLEELKSFGLQSSDQVRIDHEQSAWRSIFEIEALQDCLEDTFSETISDANTDKGTIGSLTSPNVSYGSFPFKKRSYTINSKSKNSFPKDPYSDFEENSILWFIRLLRQNPFTIAYVFIIVVCGTIVLKNIVDNVIRHTFPMEQISMVATSKPQVNNASDKMFQNALVREWIHPQKKYRKARKTVVTTQDIKKRLTLTSNNYKKGFFGGIRDLQLTINNTSNHFVNQVEIEVCYKDKNGKLVDTKNFEVESIPALGNRLISIPPSLKGVKVNYRILNIYATQPGSLSKEI
jgi:hypothetical protein